MNRMNRITILQKILFILFILFILSKNSLPESYRNKINKGKTSALTMFCPLIFFDNVVKEKPENKKRVTGLEPATPSLGSLHSTN